MLNAIIQINAEVKGTFLVQGKTDNTGGNSSILINPPYMVMNYTICKDPKMSIYPNPP